MNTHEQAVRLVEMICEEYRISKTTLRNKRSAHTKKNNRKNYISICSIRQALSYFIFMHFPLRITEVANLVGYKDHSPMSQQRGKIEHYINTKDLYFYPYYLKVQDYAYLIGIDTKCKRLIHHEIPFLRYENNLDFMSNIKHYENAEKIC